MQTTKDLVFKISGIIILVAALVYIFSPTIAPWIMALAVAIFSAIVATSPYPGKSIRGKRLFNFQILGCVFMVVATYLMFKQRNEWPLIMLIGAIFLLYASVVLPKELQKENEL